MKKTMNLNLVAVLAVTLGMVACGPKKSETKKIAPTDSKLAALVKGMKWTAGKDDASKAFDGSIKGKITKAGTVLTASLTFNFPEATGLKGDNLTAKADVKKPNVAVKATAEGGNIEPAEVTAVQMGCTPGCEGAIVTVVVKYGEGEEAKELKGAAHFDFKGGNTGSLAGKVIDIKSK